MVFRPPMDHVMCIPRNYFADRRGMEYIVLLIQKKLTITMER
jgi:hypothetical protein